MYAEGKTAYWTCVYDVSLDVCDSRGCRGREGVGGGEEGDGKRGRWWWRRGGGGAGVEKRGRWG